MITSLFPEIESDERNEEEASVHAWRVDQLWKLGLPRFLAEKFADAVGLA